MHGRASLFRQRWRGLSGAEHTAEQSTQVNEDKAERNRAPVVFVSSTNLIVVRVRVARKNKKARRNYVLLFDTRYSYYFGTRTTTSSMAAAARDAVNHVPRELRTRHCSSNAHSPSEESKENCKPPQSAFASARAFSYFRSGDSLDATQSLLHQLAAPSRSRGPLRSKSSSCRAWRSTDAESGRS